MKHSGRLFYCGLCRKQSYEIFNRYGQLLNKCDFQLGSIPHTVTLNIKKERDQPSSEYLVIIIKMLNPITPKAAGLPEGERLLGMGLSTIYLSPKEPREVEEN